jgi:hypothetical protein
MQTVKGSDLRVGDTIDVWWKPHRDTITSLTAYKGPLAHIFIGGAQIAGFVHVTGMTIDNNALYAVTNRST